jgi:hypothetical protein
VATAPREKRDDLPTSIQGKRMAAVFPSGEARGKSRGKKEVRFMASNLFWR